MPLLTCDACDPKARKATRTPDEVVRPCPLCGSADSVRVIRVIHFIPADPKSVPRGGTGLALCDGKPVMGRMATGEPRAATCPDCLSHPELPAFTPSEE